MEYQLYLPRLLILLPLASSLSASHNTTTGGCDLDAAAHCMTYRNLPPELQHTECANTTKAIGCLEELLARCASLQNDDLELHDVILDAVVKFKVQGECSAAPLVTASIVVLMSLLPFWSLAVGHTS